MISRITNVVTFILLGKKKRQQHTGFLVFSRLMCRQFPPAWRVKGAAASPKKNSPHVAFFRADP